MEGKEELEIYLDDYIQSLNKNYPCFIEYLNRINELSFYINYLGEMIIDMNYINCNYLKQDFTKDEVYELCLEVVRTLGYENEFKYMFNNGIIKYKKEKKGKVSITKVKNDNLSVKVYINNTVMDVMRTIHEFFHYLHIKEYNKKLKEDKCYFFAETFAAIGELYTILYLYNNSICKEDVVTYLKSYFNAFHLKANKVLLNGTLIDIYNKYHTLDNEVIEQYIVEEEQDVWVKNIVEYNNELESFDFFEEAGYSVALIPALLTAISMQDNNDVILNVKDCIENIHEYDTMEKLYKKLNIYDLIYNQDDLIKVVIELYRFFSDLIYDDKINYQKKLGGL